MTQQFEPFQKILVRDNDHDNWRCGFFSHMREKMAFKYVATEGIWGQCIPYEGNEHLLGTSTNPIEPEPEFKFGDHVEVSNDQVFWSKAVYYRNVPLMSSRAHWAITEDTEVMSWKHCRKADW